MGGGLCRKCPTSQVSGLLAQEHSNHHRIGQLYNYIVDNRLAEKAGFKDARAYLSQEVAALSQASLSTYGAVANSL